MSESREQYATSSVHRTKEFNTPDSKFNQSKRSYGDMKTDYKRDHEETPTKSYYNYQGLSDRKQNTGKKTEPGASRHQERRSSSAERKRYDDSDPTLDKIQDEIKSIGERLREIHLETIGKEPGNLEEERRELRKRLIELDYDHKMICAKKHIYGKDGPVSTTAYMFSPSVTSSSVRLAQIQAELALIRSRRLLDLQSDLLLWDSYLDWPYYSSYYLYRPYRYYDSLLYDPYYSSLWWL